MIEVYRALHDLPAHPLAAEGYPSIGRRHCTDRVAPGEDSRAGRWRERGKVECGIIGDMRRVERPRRSTTRSVSRVEIDALRRGGHGTLPV